MQLRPTIENHLAGMGTVTMFVDPQSGQVVGFPSTVPVQPQFRHS